SVSRFSLVSLDAATLIQTALDDGEYSWLQRSDAVTQFGRAALQLVTSLSETFVRPPLEIEKQAAQQPQDLWKARYYAGLEQLKQAGIKTVADERAGAELYVAQRAKWDRYIEMLAPLLGYTMDEIDPATSRVKVQGVNSTEVMRDVAYARPRDVTRSHH